MASKCIIDSKLADDSSKIARGYTYHCDRRSVISVSPIYMYLGDTRWICRTIVVSDIQCMHTLVKASAVVGPAKY